MTDGMSSDRTIPSASDAAQAKIQISQAMAAALPQAGRDRSKEARERFARQVASCIETVKRSDGDGQAKPSLDTVPSASDTAVTNGATAQGNQSASAKATPKAGRPAEHADQPSPPTTARAAHDLVNGAAKAKTPKPKAKSAKAAATPKAARPTEQADQPSPPTTARSAHALVNGAAKAKTPKPKAKSAKTAATPKAARPTAQAAHDLAKEAPQSSARNIAAGSERTSRSDAGQAEQTLGTAVNFGMPRVASYGAACSAIFTQHLQQTAQRQTDMFINMLRAHSPGEMMLAGNKYLLAGMRDCLTTNMQIFLASARAGTARN